MGLYGLVWLIALVIFLFFEAITVSLVSIWFAAGALASLIVSFFVKNLIIQVSVFLAVSLVTLISVRPLASKYVNSRSVATNSDAVIGKVGVVTEAIDNMTAKGQVFVFGNTWTARSDDNTEIPLKAKVKVLRIEGVKLIVSQVESDN